MAPWGALWVSFLASLPQSPQTKPIQHAQQKLSEPLALKPNERNIEKTGFKGVWPFKVTAGRLDCVNDQIVFHVGSTKYPINGAAEDRAEDEKQVGWSGIEDILTNKDGNAQDVLEEGLELCELAKGPPPINLRKISKDDFIGCIDKDYFERLVGYAADKDTVAFNRGLQSGLLLGTCTTFKVNEPVFLEDTSVFAGLVKVRRRGGTQEYWTNIEATKR